MTNELTPALTLIKYYEGVELEPYLCPAKVPTIGYGTTVYPDGKRVAMSDKPLTKQEAEKYLSFYVKNLSLQVNSFLSKFNISLLNHEKCALISFCYNLGLAPLTQSHRSLHQAILTKDRQQIADAMELYCNAGGKRLTGLVLRRRAEATLFLKGEVILC